MIDCRIDSEGIATIEWALPGRTQNVLNAQTLGAFREIVGGAIADPRVKGLLIASAKKDFIAGGDLEGLLRWSSAEEVFRWSIDHHAFTRALERCGKPVAAALNGSALGGGMELALACHYRVAADNPKARFGFPEVTLGLLPGAGGTQRAPRLIGMQAALPLLVEGKRIGAREAAKLGLIHAVVPAGQEREAARAWLLGEGQQGARQPWDAKGFRIPGGGPGTPAGMQTLMGANAMLRSRTYGNYPAPRHILSCVYEGLATDLDTGLKIEARYFAALVPSPEAKNMIRTLFFGMNEANKLAGRPQGVPARAFPRIGIIGAGMMGAAIAHAAASAGIEVALLDVTGEAAERGKDYSARLVALALEKGRIDHARGEALLGRIHPGADYADLADCSLAIEAVFEDRALKAEVTRRAEAALAPDAIFATNTSTLPISGLAEASGRPESFIGLHFFSPADRMPLVEVIVGQRTSRESLAQAMDFVKAIGKTPVVVRDSRGFYTSRVFATYLNEGMALLEEGVAPALIDKAGLIAGMPVGPLALADEVSLELIWRIGRQTRADLGPAWQERAADRVSALMVERLGRVGKKGGKGFYDHPHEGRKHLWTDLGEHFPERAPPPAVEEIVERLIAIQSIETVRCLEENVVARPMDADVGALLGWGYPAFRGGPIGWIHTRGIARFVADCERLAERHGPRFAPPQRLKDMAQKGERFYEV